MKIQLKLVKVNCLSDFKVKKMQKKMNIKGSFYLRSEAQIGCLYGVT